MAGVLALVSFNIYPARMGGQKGVAKFYEHLSNYTPVHLFTTGEASPAGAKSLVQLYPNKLMPLNLFKRRAMLKEAFRLSPDVVIAEHSYTGWLAKRLASRLGIPFILHSHNLEYKRFRLMGRGWWPLFMRYEARISRQAHYNFFISEEDRQEAIRDFHINAANSTVITYGVDQPRMLSMDRAREALKLPADQYAYLFNGTLDYEPNVKAVEVIIQELIPRLRKQQHNFRVIITGNRVTPELEAAMKAVPELDFRGFVDDINLYYDAADLFLNPVANDSGVKTKLIESIARGCPAVSLSSGANGIRKEVCGPLLQISPDGDWDQFSQQILWQQPGQAHQTPDGFLEYYGWDAIVRRAYDVIVKLSQNA